MAVTASDMKFRLSGGLSNTDQNASIGGAISETDVVSNTLQNLFDNVSGAQAASGITEYRCIYILNDHATDTINSLVIWIQSNTPSADTIIAIALDPAGIGDGTSTGVAATPSPLDESTPPPGVDFAVSPLPVDEATAISIGTLTAGQAQAVWIRRIVSAAAVAVSNDAATLRISGTPA